jgi:integrase
MPKYKKEYDRKIEPEEVQAMINKAKHPSHRFLIAVLYLTGARSSEIVELKRRDFEIVGNDLRIALRTKKGGRPRVLPFDLDSPFVRELILPYLEQLPEAESWALPFRTTPRVRQIIYETSGNTLCPYAFRHSRLTRLAEDHATVPQLMMWKGSKDMSSVADYLFLDPSHLNEFKRKIK